MVRDDELVFIEEHVGDGNRLVQQAAGITAQIENHSVQAREVELLEGCGKFRIGFLIELRDAHITDSRANSESYIDRMLRNFVPGNGERKRLSIAFANHVDVHDGALWPL